MKVKPENIDPAARAVNVNPTNTEAKSSFAGRTFGTGAGNKTFMTKEVMSALDKKDSTSIPETSIPETSMPEDTPVGE
jgi:hypothetical protein